MGDNERMLERCVVRVVLTALFRMAALRTVIALLIAIPLLVRCAVGEAFYRWSASAGCVVLTYACWVPRLTTLGKQGHVMYDKRLGINQVMGAMNTDFEK
jgi:hypothetical protein